MPHLGWVHSNLLDHQEQLEQELGRLYIKLARNLNMCGVASSAVVRIENVQNKQKT